MATPDLTEFEELAQRPPRRRCKVDVALGRLSDEDRRKAEAALAAPRERIPVGAIEKWFTQRIDNGPSISSITHHRSGRCTCVND